MLAVKNLPANTGDIRDTASIPGSERFPWRRERLPTPVFLLGESNRKRSLVGYNLWGCKEPDMTEVTTYTHTCINACLYLYLVCYRDINVDICVFI